MLLLCHITIKETENENHNSLGRNHKTNTLNGHRVHPVWDFTETNGTVLYARWGDSMSYDSRPSRCVRHKCATIPYEAPSGGSRKHPEGVLVVTLVIFAVIGLANLCIMLYNGIISRNEATMRK